MIAIGLLLQAKKHWTWVQPAEQPGTGTQPFLNFDGILAGLKSVPEMHVQSWDASIASTCIRGAGWSRSGSITAEIQVDFENGAILQTAYRRSDLIESIHDGSLFGGDWVKLGLFLPAGIVLLLLWLSGLWMWWAPFIAKRRRRVARTSNIKSPVR